MQLTKWVHEPIWISKVKVIHWPWSKVTQIHIFKLLFLRNGPIEAKFLMEPPWDGGMKVCPNGPDHMTNMATIPIYGKNLKKIFFSGTNQPMTLKIGLQHRALEYYQIYSNADPVLTLTYYMTRSNLVPYAFVWEKGNIMDFSETIVVYDIKVGRFIQLNEYMNLYEYQRPRSFTDLRPRSIRFNILKLLLLRNR